MTISKSQKTSSDNDDLFGNLRNQLKSQSKNNIIPEEVNNLEIALETKTDTEADRLLDISEEPPNWIPTQYFQTSLFDDEDY